MSGARRSQVRHLLVLLAVCGFLLFFGLGSRPLWDTDEGMHAATSLEMVRTGDWLTPRLNGVPFLDKPPLFNWLVAASFALFGANELAARLPGALLGLATVLLAYALGRRMFGATAGLLGALALGASVEFVMLSRVVGHDMLLTFLVTMALAAFWFGRQDPGRRGRWFLLMHASCGLALLAKGPLGVVLPALVIGPYLLVERRLGLLRELRLGWGVLVVLAIAAPWYVLMDRINPGYLQYFLLEQNLGSFFSADARHPRPFHYYLGVVGVGFLPWSFLLPLLPWRSLRAPRDEPERAARFLLVWLSAIFLFFALAESKLASYLLPIFPAAALLVGRLWDDLLRRREGGIRRGALAALLSLGAAVAGVALFAVLSPAERLEIRPETGPRLVQLLVVLGVAGVWGAVGLALAGRYAGSFAALVAWIVGSVVAFVLVLAPAIEPYYSTRGLTRQLDALLRPHEPLVFFGRMRDSGLFYTGRRAIVLEKPWQLERYLASPERVFFISGPKYLDDARALRERLHVVTRDGDRLLISNRADP